MLLSPSVVRATFAFGWARRFQPPADRPQTGGDIERRERRGYAFLGR